MFASQNQVTGVWEYTKERMADHQYAIRSDHNERDLLILNELNFNPYCLILYDEVVWIAIIDLKSDTVRIHCPYHSDRYASIYDFLNRIASGSYTYLGPLQFNGTTASEFMYIDKKKRLDKKKEEYGNVNANTVIVWFNRDDIVVGTKVGFKSSAFCNAHDPDAIGFNSLMEVFLNDNKGEWHTVIETGANWFRLQGNDFVWSYEWVDAILPAIDTTATTF